VSYSSDLDINTSYMFALLNFKADEIRWSDPGLIFNGVLIPAMGVFGIVETY
jgi:hypothetical protein